jgi:hypothetical protein
MSKIPAAMAAGAATLALMVAPVAHADPTPDPTPGYTWECDTSSNGHTTCRAVATPDCAVSSDGKWVVVLAPGTLNSQIAQGQRLLTPAPCTGGPPDFRSAPRLIDSRGPAY